MGAIFDTQPVPFLTRKLSHFRHVTCAIFDTDNHVLWVIINHDFIILEFCFEDFKTNHTRLMRIKRWFVLDVFPLMKLFHTSGICVMRSNVRHD